MSKLQQTIRLALTISFCLGLFSCDNDSFIQSTGKDGRPSAFETENGVTIGLFYQGTQLITMKNKDGSSTGFTYGDRSILRVFFEPPHGMADGHGDISFIQDGENKIRIESWGEPSSVRNIKEMELDDQARPVKITNLGYFQWTEKGEEKLGEGKEFALFSYDPTTGLLSRIDEHRLSDGQLQTSYSFSYENSPGIMSQVDLPAWFSIYWGSRYIGGNNSVDLQFLNYKNNLQEIKTNPQEEDATLLSLHYTYNKSDYPVTVSDQKEPKNKIRIQY